MHWRWISSDGWTAMDDLGWIGNGFDGWTARDWGIEPTTAPPSVSAAVLSPSQPQPQSQPQQNTTSDHAVTELVEPAITVETITPQHPPIAIGLVSSNDEVWESSSSSEREDSKQSKYSVNSKRETHIIRSDKSRRERKLSNSFEPGNGGGGSEVFPLSLIYGENHVEHEGSVSYYHEHSYDNAMKFSLRKVNRTYGGHHKQHRTVKLSRRSRNINKKIKEDRFRMEWKLKRIDLVIVNLERWPHSILALCAQEKKRGLNGFKYDKKWIAMIHQ